ncbi:hypothetical protein ACF0H5_020760 [Mactra antiquata]
MDYFLKTTNFAVLLVLLGILVHQCATQRIHVKTVNRPKQQIKPPQQQLPSHLQPKQQEQQQTSSNVCDSCPPTWIPLLDQFKAMLVPHVMEAICPLAEERGFLDTCSVERTTCTTKGTKPKSNPKNPVKFCCCPAKSLSKVADCYKNITNICIPDQFEPWQDEIQSTIIKILMSGVLGR